MSQFSGVRDASEFIVSLIDSLIDRRAIQLGEPLSTVEREMLYFSETGWTLPGMMQTAATFERNYVEGDYEKKIANLIASVLRELKKGSKEELAAWCEAVWILREEDRYLLVMIDEAGVKVRPPGDLWKPGEPAWHSVPSWFSLVFLLSDETIRFIEPVPAWEVLALKRGYRTMTRQITINARGYC